MPGGNLYFLRLCFLLLPELRWRVHCWWRLWGFHHHCRYYCPVSGFLSLTAIGIIFVFQNSLLLIIPFRWSTVWSLCFIGLNPFLSIWILLISRTISLNAASPYVVTASLTVIFARLNFMLAASICFLLCLPLKIIAKYCVPSSLSRFILQYNFFI